MATDSDRSGYVIAIGGSTDVDRFGEEYDPAVAEYGGAVLVRSSDPDVLEGEPAGDSVFVVKFPTVEAAKAWYREAAGDCSGTARGGNLLLVPESRGDEAPSRWRSFHPAWRSREKG